MAKFVYRLQNVLDVKLKLENQARTNFSMAAAKVNEEEERLSGLYLQKKNFEDEYRKKSSGKLNVFELKHAKDNISYITGRIKEQKKNLDMARKSLEIARFQLNEAMKERKIHERLKENAFDEFVHEVNESEKKEIDQLVSFRYNNNGEEGEN